MSESPFSSPVGRTAAPLRGQVIDLLREAILDFRFAPGTRLVERDLTEKLGVGRSTIREALRQLEAEGLVRTVPHKGVVVGVLGPEEAAEVYEVRAALEALAARRFAERATGAQVRALRECVLEYEKLAAVTDDPRALLEVKDRFYAVLLDGAGSETIERVLSGLQARVRVMRARSMSRAGRPAESARELHRMVDAFEARDAEAALAACEAHLERAAALGVADAEELPAVAD